MFIIIVTPYRPTNLGSAIKIWSQRKRIGIDHATGFEISYPELVSMCEKIKINKFSLTNEGFRGSKGKGQF